MFMDDLKLFEEDRGELEITVEITDEVSSALGMTLGLKKCAMKQVRKGRVMPGGSIGLSEGRSITQVQYGDTYSTWVCPSF